MSTHIFTSASPDQQFQPSCINEMVRFFNGEAVIENDAVAAELDSLIAAGKVPEIQRLDISKEADQVAALEAKVQAKKERLAALQSGEGISRAVIGGTTTSNVVRKQEPLKQEQAKQEPAK